MKTRAYVTVSGFVQGVCFRANTRREAQGLNVSGWIRNTRDSKIEAIFEGEKENVKKMIQFCTRGPSGSRVTDIEVRWEDFKGEFSSFVIKY